MRATSARTFEEFNAVWGGGLTGDEISALGHPRRIDEMSADIGRERVTKNIKDLLDCIREFDGVKI